MLRELIIAVIFGAVLGFGITGSLFALNKSNKNHSPPSSLPIPTVSTTDTTPLPSPITSTSPEPVNNILKIDSPKNDSIVSNSKVTIKGNAVGNSLIIIITSTKSYHTLADNNGSFNQEIELDSGINFINVSAVDPNDNQVDTQITITYSTAKI